MTVSNLVRNWPTRAAQLLSVLWIFAASAAGPGPWSLDAKRGT